MIQTLLLIITAIFVGLLGLSAAVHLFFLVPYVPSAKKTVKRLLELAELRPGMTLMDLGCGDGRVVVEAAKHEGVKAIGFEIAPLMYLMALINNLFTGRRADIRFENIFNADLHSADIIICYLFPGAMARLDEKIKKECKKGTVIISNTFSFPGRDPVSILPADPHNRMPKVYSYRV
ncbi:hypothetical protein CO046_04700 [Candidatus Peregrinibacteria bacterium CG_4_9_14_0_2_um_filter_53_11]|nr:MAG: hypothetical protein CO046_04700 [Candidatus Peregrinibacteria bacterium CG_4_9_14_0_2_um_filter_53_11]